MKGIPETSCAC